MENTKKYKLSGRQKRKFRSYGLTKEEAIAEIAQRKANYKAWTDSQEKNIHCSYMDYVEDNSKHLNLIKQAISLGIGGKHVYSMPERKIKDRLKAINRQITKYMTALHEAEKIRARLEAQKAAEEQAAAEQTPEIVEAPVADESQIDEQ